MFLANILAWFVVWNILFVVADEEDFLKWNKQVQGPLRGHVGVTFMIYVLTVS